MLSNLELISEFVQVSIQNRDILLSNSTLNAQTVYYSNQLTAKSEGVIASIQLNNRPVEFLVSANSSYWELINELLAKHNYILGGEIDKRGFYKYRYCQIPKGYRMNCTKAVLLWRAWWKYRKNLSRPGIPLDLLFRTRDSWYPIRDLVISDGVIYIKILGGEIEIQPDDLIIWLSKVEVNSQK